MSHSRQRKDKVCLNCDAEVYGRYCHVCGQENIEPKETAWGLVTHFFNDITHFDGKFFSTVKYLLFKPGFLSKEYVKGRRARYLHPIRMYVFTSAVFFIVFFSIVKVNIPGFDDNSPFRTDSLNNRIQSAESLALEDAETKADSQRITALIRSFDGTRKEDSRRDSASRSGKTVKVSGLKYESVAAYDSAQRSLPVEKRDGWYQRMKTRKMISFSEEANKDPQAFFQRLTDEIFHSFPQLLFVSLPIFAFLLKILYLRSKPYYYADHGIFTIHLYIFTFISLFILMMLNKLHGAVRWKMIGYIELAIGLYTVYYTYRAMKNFYQQGYGKTFLKFCLLNLLSFIMISFLFLLFVLLSIYEI